MNTHVVYDDVFGPSRNRELYELALSMRGQFTHSRTTPSHRYPNWRRSNVLYDHQLADAATHVQREVHARLSQVMAALDVPSFEIGITETQLTSHNDGEYYHWHTDNGSPHTASRTVSFVYYFHAEPKSYSGGELIMYSDSAEPVVIDPRNDSLIFFDSSRKHEVRPVTVSSQRFEDGRFTINGWIRRREHARADGYFDAKIFTLPPRARVRARSEAQPSRHVDVRTGLDAADFYENYYFANRPVVLKGAVANSPAVRRWSPDFFATDHGSVPVQITDHREADVRYEQNFRQSVCTVTLGAFVDRLRREPVSNDYYLVARNFFFDRPELRSLRHDLRPPPGLVNIEEGTSGSVKMWFGPGGTITPLHFDEHSVLLAQVFGRKWFKLIAPFDDARVYPRDRYYSDVDPEHVDPLRHPDFMRASVADVVVEPGDLLFLPVRWWHWARSLDVSISATFSSFAVPTNVRLPRSSDIDRVQH